MNGRLYDTTLASYSNSGLSWATKGINNNIFSQSVRSSITDTLTLFAIMCPTQLAWQNIMKDSANQITSRLNMDGVYIDQVTASSPIGCMDASHNHTLGGGNFWRSGYKTMFQNIHSTIPSGKFITSEGASEFLVDEVDGFLTEEFITNNQVPAFIAIYGGKVQFIGPRTGASDYSANTNPDS